MTGSVLADARACPRMFFAAVIRCRSDPHMPEAFISSTTSPGPGVDRRKFMVSTERSPGKVTPRVASSVLLFRRRLYRINARPDGRSRSGAVPVRQMHAATGRRRPASVEKALPLDRCGSGQHFHLDGRTGPVQRHAASGFRRMLTKSKVRFAQKSLGSSGEPAAFAAVENVAVWMSPCRTTMSRGSASSACARQVRLSEQAALCPCGRPRASNHRTRGTRSGGGSQRAHAGAQAACHRSDGLVVAAGGDYSVSERCRLPVEQQRLTMPRRTLRTIAVHQQQPRRRGRSSSSRAIFQHGRLAVVAHGQQQLDGVVIGSPSDDGPRPGAWCRESIAAVAADTITVSCLRQLLARDLDGAPVGQTNRRRARHQLSKRVDWRAP